MTDRGATSSTATRPMSFEGSVRPEPDTGWGDERWVAPFGIAAVVAFCLGLFYLATATDADTWVPVMVFSFLLFVTVPICHWAAGKPTDRRLRRILILALVLKLLMIGPRYYLNEVFYKGEGDAARYHQAGGYLVQNMMRGEFSIDGSELVNFPPNTRMLGYITGALYLVFGTSLVGGYLVFSWLAWLGLLLFFRAFQVAYPNAPPYRAAMLVFFMPSLLFWPSSIGKEAIMLFLVGLMTLGSARLLCGRKQGLGVTWIALAGIGMLNLRPHLLIISAIALFASLLARPTGRDGRRQALARILVVVVLVPVLVASLGRMDTLFGTSGGGTSSIDQTLDETISATSIGGSAFQPTPVRGVLDMPLATVTVIFRPFIFEARSGPTLLSGLEGTLLIVATIAAARWIWEIGPAMYRSNFAAYCGGFILGFVIAFSYIGNAGILSRQRVQMFPLLMLLAAAAHEHHRLRMIRVAAQKAAEAAGERYVEPDPDDDAEPLGPVPVGSGL